LYRKCGSLDISKLYGPTRPVISTALLFLIYVHTTQTAIAQADGSGNDQNIQNLGIISSPTCFPFPQLLFKRLSTLLGLWKGLKALKGHSTQRNEQESPFKICQESNACWDMSEFRIWVVARITLKHALGGRLCGLAVRLPGCRTEIYCVSCEVWTKFICYAEESRPPLWSSGQSSWLQIQRSGFDSRRYQIFWEVVGLEQGPLSLVSISEELLGRNSSGCGLENREYGRMDPSCSPRGTLYPQKLALTSPTSGSRSVGIVRSLTQATEFYALREEQKVTREGTMNFHNSRVWGDDHGHSTVAAKQHNRFSINVCVCILSDQLLWPVVLHNR
jgi:hypothetical protein